MKMMVLLLMLASGTVVAVGQQPLGLVLVRNAPPYSTVLSKVDLTSLVQRAKAFPFAPEGLNATDDQQRSVSIQFVPDSSFDPRQRITGWLLLQLPKEGIRTVTLHYQSRSPTPVRWDGTASLQNGAVTIYHEPQRMGGLPSRITFHHKRSKEFATFVWNDRIHHRQLGSFHLRNDLQPSVELVSDGPIATVVRVRSRYLQGTPTKVSAPESAPEATYHWFYFRTLPLVFVTVIAQQKSPFVWHEWHFLELNFPDESFVQWAGGEPVQTGKFTASQRSFGFADWGALLDPPHAIAVLRSGQALFHDGRSGYGTYLHAHGDRAWQDWSTTEQTLSAWLFVGSTDDPTSAIRQYLQHLPSDAQVVPTHPEVRREIVKAKGWRRALAEQLEAQGRLHEALQIAQGKLPANWHLLGAGELGLAMERTTDGLRLQSLFDLTTNSELLATPSLPLFALTLRHALSKQTVSIAADAGWKSVNIQRERNRLTIHWQRYADDRLSGVRVIATASFDHTNSAVRWRLEVQNDSKEWSVWRIVFPQLTIADLGESAEVFFPRGPGEVQRHLWRRSFVYRSLYPNGWCTMQFLAAYGGTGNGKRGIGIYVGGHDPLGSAKDIVVRSDPQNKQVVLAFDHPTPNMGIAGNDFALSGEVVWQLLRGDWFDAAVIYRDWVRRHARWFPKLTKDGRSDTPQWMKELCVWALGGGAPEECVEAVKRFAAFMGVPVGFHWYNWHRIPFDNDYPHYFPAKEGFAEGVHALQQASVFVMPYINGRLWDTRDKGVDDWQFSAVALPAATKQEDGSPYTESYGSKEADGSDVRLAPMCPTTKLWQDKVREIVLRLLQEVGVRGVYIDQVAAASPALCFDRTHGHPLGGGAWWNEGYWRMLDAIRAAMPKDRMLTTECNAEPFVRWFDGYLTWHWQHDGQVPAFPVVYGGAVQMFGRAYRGGATKDLALRMKAGQQLVFGEQIGWIDPNIVQEKENAEFLRQVVRLRWHLRRFFYAGEMARPPKLVGNIPKVRADWQWWGEWWVETDAVLTGAWQLPREGKVVLLFVHVGDEPASATLHFDARTYGITLPFVRVTEVSEHGFGKMTTLPARWSRTLTFPPRKAWAWLIER